MERQHWEENIEKYMAIFLNEGGDFDGALCGKLTGHSFEEGTVTMEFATLPWERNGRGFVHGGAISGIFDTAFAALSNFLAEKGAVTGDLTVSFIRAVEVGETLEIKVYLVKQGRSLIRLRGELFSKENGKLAATAVTTYMPV